MGVRIKSTRMVAVSAGLVCALLLCSALAVAGGSKMRSTKLDKHLCRTVGGGKIVDIPAFPGERIDRRLLADIRWMRKRWNIFVTDGYSRDPAHSQNGEHPLGLALDIAPDKASGGSWRQIDRLAAWAEPRQDQPRSPFRWVGYDGDAGHGHGHHLHLSWNHSDAEPYTRARTVDTVLCPGTKSGGGKGGGGTGGTGSGDGGGKGDGSGGVDPGDSGGSGGIDPREGDRSSGGITPLRHGIPAGSVETAGIDLDD
jgi:hypothetical protein